MSPSFPRQVASVVLRTAPVFHEPSPADARWDALKAHLRTERDAAARETREWQEGGSMWGRYNTRFNAACETLARMSELEQQR